MRIINNDKKPTLEFVVSLVQSSINERVMLRYFWGYLGGISRNLRFSLFSVVIFYYVINKLIILVSVPH
jgi:hypothetical protein